MNFEVGSVLNFSHELKTLIEDMSKDIFDIGYLDMPEWGAAKQLKLLFIPYVLQMTTE